MPDGFLHLRGIYRGVITSGGSEFEWRGRQFGRRFTLSQAGVELACFEARVEPVPVAVDVKTSSLEALIVLFCCHLAKQAVDTARVGAGMAGTSVVLGG